MRVGLPLFGHWCFADDLKNVLEATGNVWVALRGARIFLTGGTGFIGRWLLESLRLADHELHLGLRITVLTRNPDAAGRKAPHLVQYKGFDFIRGDITNFPNPPGSYSHFVHAATDASAHLNEHDPRQMFDTVVVGTRRVLDLAVEKAPDRFLFLSSGAVYGQQPSDMELVPESWMGGPDCAEPRSTYAEAKRAAELLCAIYAKQFGVRISTARIFALLGPHIALDTHFAAGNFIRDAIAGRPVIVKGSGLACRSYLYAADLAIWLLQLLVQGRANSAYNVGSEEWVSILDLAERISKILAHGEFRVLGAPDTGWNPGRYAPDTRLARRELGLKVTVPLNEAIRRTALSYGWRGP